MSASRISLSASSDIKVIVANIRQHVAKGTTQKLLEDENFVFNMLKLMVEDSVDNVTKTEFLRVLEEYGGDVFDAKSIDEVVSNLFGIFRQYQDRDDCVNFLTQLLITVTTLLVSCTEITADPIASLIEILWGIAAKVNDVSNRRLRAAACQCMAQLEDLSPGVIWKWRDRLLQAVKQDRSDVCQDYVPLLTTVIYHIAGDIISPECPLTPDIGPRSSVDRTLSSESNEILSAVSFIMEHSSLFTPAGLWDIVTSLSGIVHSAPGISPSIFKPLMLHHMATQDPTLLHIILYLQREFSGEILTSSEEKLLLTRLMTAVNQRSINPAHRLLCLQWLKGYCHLESEEDGVSGVMVHVREKLVPKLLPSVFDSIDMHVGKATVINTCCRDAQPHAEEQKEMTWMMLSLTYLRKLTVNTGHNKAAAALFRSLYSMQLKHCTDTVSQRVSSICKSVLYSYPKLIPLVLDFLLCVRETATDKCVYMDILCSLHNQVLSSTPEDVLRQFQFHLRILKTSAKEPDIHPQSGIKYLLSLAECAISTDRCSWGLGNAVLGVCRSILLNHSTEGIFTELGDLLHEMMLNYLDIDIQDKARFYYALLTGASDKKIREVLSDAMQGGSMTEQSFSSLLPGSLNQPMRTELHQVDQPVLKWERLSLDPLFTVKKVLEDSKDIQQYKYVLSSLTVCLQIQHRLQVLAYNRFTTLHAVSVKIDTDSNYKLLKDIHVASMNQNDEKKLMVELQPRSPQPASFTTSAMFASETNDTYVSDLPDLHVTFEDLLLPFPWQQIGIPDSEREGFYSHLWNHITSCEDPMEGIESVMVLTCPLKTLEDAWSPYRVAPHGYHFIIFLPASYHLLISLDVKSDNIVVSMATDNWKILTHINEYLQTFDS